MEIPYANLLTLGRVCVCVCVCVVVGGCIQNFAK